MKMKVIRNEIHNKFISENTCIRGNPVENSLDFVTENPSTLSCMYPKIPQSVYR